jgi:serine/threonine protein kinase
MPDKPLPKAWQKTQLMPRREKGSGLPRGTRLQEYVIDGLVGVGGFSIVYRAADSRLNRSVAIKEYIPAALATRGAGGAVVARSPRHEAHFALGLKSFIGEARLLAAFDHPSLVKVYRFWAENGSAYMAMPLYEGLTLQKWLANLGAPPSEAWLRALAAPLMEAVGTLHRERCFHRDIAPDNILLLPDPLGGSYLEQAPRPLLLDFGAARRVIGEATQTLTAILKPGYSPIEQYGQDETLRQGPWTDVYALSALLYRAVVGKVPNSSVARFVRDEMVPASRAGAGRYSSTFLAAIDAGLAVRPDARPQSMADLRDAFDGCWLPTPPSPIVVVAPPPPAAPPPATPRQSRWAAAAGWWRTLFRR